MRIVAIIPARGGSKGIPKKNLINLSGKPLLAWSIIQCQESKLVNEVYVSSDCDEILENAVKYRAKPIKRPAEFSTDTATSESVLLHAINLLETDKTNLIDIVVFLQATSPLRESSDIDGAIEKLINENADSLFSSALLEDFFIFEEKDNNFISVNFDYKNRPRRQDVKHQYLENGSIYLFKPWVLRKVNNRLGGKIVTFEMPFWKSYEIDSLGDLEICEWYMNKNLVNKNTIGINKKNIDLIVYDFDGVMTDNKVLVMDNGQEGIIANRADGQGVSLIKKMGMNQIIISTETNPVVSVRAKKLGLYVIQGCENKSEALIEYCKNKKIDISRVVYVGNDVNDLECMKLSGYPIAPNDAHSDVKKISKIILKTPGGEGVVREIADIISAD